MEKQKKIKALLEMRPAMDGFAGIPQEVRLLFRGLRKIDKLEVEGMIQHPSRILARGMTPLDRFFGRVTPAKKYNRFSRVIISLAELPYRNIVEQIIDYFTRKLATTSIYYKTLLGVAKVKLSSFESHAFEDFTWRTLFAKTLPAGDFDLVAKANHRICSVPWTTMHMAGLKTLNVFGRAKYPLLDTQGFDIFIAQTPYPGRVPRGTKMVIRYHDALPVFMPHTIANRSLHQATHFHGLVNNYYAGAYFACVSEATRNDLLKIVPEAADKAVVIYNMVSHHYFRKEVPFDRVPGIIRARLIRDEALNLTPKFLTLKEQDNFYQKKLYAKEFRYLLIVSTIEPRKNHMRLLAAWEMIRAEIDPEIKLIVVGTPGWDNDLILKAFRSWIDRGELFMLASVPAPDLRVLYRHAAATVCPSLGEGFDFSGVESMASGGITVASDIPVHREVYGNAAEYFDPYSTISLVKALQAVLYDESAPVRKQQLLEEGDEVAARYTPDKILPQWESFLGAITN